MERFLASKEGRLKMVIVVVLLLVVVPAAVLALTSIGTSLYTDGQLTAREDVTLRDVGFEADTILIGDSSDTVTVAGDISLTDTQWYVTSAGVARFVYIDTGTMVSPSNMTITPGSGVLTIDGVSAFSRATIGPSSTPLRFDLRDNQAGFGNATTLELINLGPDTGDVAHFNISEGDLKFNGIVRISNNGNIDANALTVGGGSQLTAHRTVTVSQNLGAPSVPGCVETTDIPLTGAVLGDMVTGATSVALPANFGLTAFVSSGGNARIRLCQLSGTAADPDGGGATYRVDLWRH